MTAKDKAFKLYRICLFPYYISDEIKAKQDAKERALKMIEYIISTCLNKHKKYLEEVKKEINKL